MHDREHARRAPGPIYVHWLQAAGDADRPAIDGRGAIAVILLDLGRDVTAALRRGLRAAVSSGSVVYVLHFIHADDVRSDEILTRSREFGERLTTAVLRLARGLLPPLVTVVVYQGTREDAATFIATSIRPDIVLATHPRDDPSAAALAHGIGRIEGCPVLLIDDECPARRRRLPRRMLRALN
jgi:hypothetical protein